jgi:hypothetical protein
MFKDIQIEVLTGKRVVAWRMSPYAAGRFPHYQFRRHFAVVGTDFALFQNGLDPLQHNAYGVRTHGFHRLAYRG